MSFWPRVHMKLKAGDVRFASLESYEYRPQGVDGNPSYTQVSSGRWAIWEASPVPWCDIDCMKHDDIDEVGSHR